MLSKKDLRELGQIFRKQYNVQLNEKDLREAGENLINYFKILVEAAMENQRKLNRKKRANPD